jgi:hypothetical protein
MAILWYVLVDVDFDDIDFGDAHKRGVEVQCHPACRMRYGRELGKPHGLLPVGKVVVGNAVIAARKGNPDTDYTRT